MSYSFDHSPIHEKEDDWIVKETKPKEEGEDE